MVPESRVRLPCASRGIPDLWLHPAFSPTKIPFQHLFQQQLGLKQCNTPRVLSLQQQYLGKTSLANKTLFG